MNANMKKYGVGILLGVVGAVIVVALISRNALPLQSKIVAGA
jgi:NhaP-type Na+/H+ and K+/H+ antiporter